MSRILAIDLGAKRIGLAGTDDEGLVALPIGILPEERKTSDRLRRIARLGQERQVDCYLVGLPLESDGNAGDAAASARDFAVRLRARTGKRTVLLDEHLTSVEAEELLRDAGRRATRGQVDPIAALVLLRAFLDGARGEELA